MRMRLRLILGALDLMCAMVKNLYLYPKVLTPYRVELDEATIYIKEKEKADAPIYTYRGFGCY
jgi:hypothetical protein